jgi:hypothetical protein
MVWIGSIWLRIGTSEGLLWTRWWTFGFHKMPGSSWVAAQLAASQEGLSSVSKYMIPLGFEVLTAVVMKSSAYIMPHGPFKVNRCFWGTCLHLQGWRISSVCCLLQADFLLGVFFGTEGGGDVPWKCELTFSGLHSVISQEIEKSTWYLLRICIRCVVMLPLN